jgi:polysaccharide biosynthesis transport protein
MPFSPVKPAKRLFLAGALLFGLFASTLVVVYVDRKDPRLRGPEDVEKHLGLENLGLLPNISKVKVEFGKPDMDLAKEFIACAEPMSVISEAARSVATSIALMTSFSETSIAVCSAMASEGKTLFSISLASVVGSEGRKVLVVEADLRRPRIGKLFGEEEPGAGLGDLLSDDSLSVQDVVRSSHLPGFHYMTAGSQPVTHPLALLKSERTAKIIEECKETFEWVIVDCPPAIGLSDVQVIAPMVEGVVVVARENYTSLHALKRLQGSVLLARGKLLGVVINMATRWPTGYPAYLYHNRADKNKLWNFLGKFG